MAFKPRNRPDHEALMASGAVVPVEVQAPAVFRHLESGDTYAIDADGKLITGYLPLRLGEVPRYQIRESGLQRFARELRRGVKGFVSLLDSPIALALAELGGFRLDAARAVVSALSQDGADRQAIALIDLYGSERMQRVADELRRRLEDGELSEEDRAALLLVLGGKA